MSAEHMAYPTLGLDRYEVLFDGTGACLHTRTFTLDEVLADGFLMGRLKLAQERSSNSPDGTSEQEREEGDRFVRSSWALTNRMNGFLGGWDGLVSPTDYPIDLVAKDGRCLDLLHVAYTGGEAQRDEAGRMDLAQAFGRESGRGDMTEIFDLRLRGAPYRMRFPAAP